MIHTGIVTFLLVFNLVVFGNEVLNFFTKLAWLFGVVCGPNR